MLPLTKKQCENRKLLNSDITGTITEYCDRVVAHAQSNYSLDLIEAGLNVYCDGMLTEHPQLLFLAESLGNVFMSWLCLHWQQNHTKSKKTNIAWPNYTHNAIIFRAQETPFAFYQVLGFSPTRRHLKIRHLLTKRSYYVSTAHLEAQHDFMAKKGQILFAMIDVQLHYPVVYAIAPNALDVSGHLANLTALHHSVRSTHPNPALIMRSADYHDIMHITYINALVKSRQIPASITKVINVGASILH